MKRCLSILLLTLLLSCKAEMPHEAQDDTVAVNTGSNSVNVSPPAPSPSAIVTFPQAYNPDELEILEPVSDVLLVKKKTVKTKRHKVKTIQPKNTTQLPMRIQPNEAYALLYHTFTQKKTTIYNTKPTDFRKQMQRLKACGYRFVSWQDIQNDKITGMSNILITIDIGDGSDTLYNVLPFLQELNIVPLLFITTAFLEKKNSKFTAEDVVYFHNLGYTIGSHSIDHPNLTEKLYRSNSKRFVAELTESKRILEEIIGVKVDTFAYPFGTYCNAAIVQSQKAGYKYAFTVRFGAIRIGERSPYLLPRYTMTTIYANSVLSMLEKKLKS